MPATGAAIGTPDAIIGSEQQQVADCGQPARRAIPGHTVLVEARLDVGNQLRAFARTIAPPELPTAAPIIRAEEQHAVEDGEVRRTGATRPWFDVLHEFGAGGRPIGLEELGAGGRREREEQSLTTDRRHLIAERPADVAAGEAKMLSADLTEIKRQLAEKDAELQEALATADALRERNDMGEKEGFKWKELVSRLRLDKNEAEKSFARRAEEIKELRQERVMLEQNASA